MRRLFALLAGLLWSSIGLCDVPTVAITYPPANATLLEAISPTILLQANASDPDEGIFGVWFLACAATGSTCDEAAISIGSSQTSPYQVTWTPPHIPTSASISVRYLVWASASNTLGQQTTSAAVPITIVQPIPAPSVKLVAPSAAIGFAAPAAPVLYATAAAGNTVPSSSIARVDFLDGGVLIGTVAMPNSLPQGYGYTWSNPALGPHQITARAVDTLGGSATSAPVIVYIFAADQAPQVALTSPSSGQAFNSTSTMPLAATATSNGRSIQRVEFVAGTNIIATSFAPPYSGNWVGPPPGNFAIVARAFDDLGVAVASPAAYVWITADPRPPAVVMTAPAPGTIVPASSPLSLGATALAPDGAIGRVDFYAGATMIGSASSAPYGFVWPSPIAGTQSLAAKAYDLKGRSTVSTPVSVTVSGKVPSVSLTSPLAGAKLIAPATIALTASASEVGGSIVRVDFYANGVLIATQGTAPYNATWSNVAAGTYSLTAKATDGVGATQVSGAITVTVANNLAPSIAITAPLNGQTFFAGQPITLTATASDSDGAVTKVEFLLDGLTIGAGSSPPFKQVSTTISAGNHTLQARATDNIGAVTTSLSVTITVGQNAAPITAITVPSDSQAFAIGQAIAIAATASDPDGTISKLEFLADGVVIGSVTASPFTRVWSGAAVGVHVLTVRATDNVGAITLSTPVAITVNSGTLPVVALTSPVVGDTFAAGDPFVLSAAASSAGGAIVKVDFYSGATTLLGTVATAPYVLSWGGVAPGSYSITAKATDARGAVATSASVDVRAITPALAITSPAVGASLPADFMIVTGTYQAPPNSGITINGVVASNDGQGNFAANNVPIASGANTFTVTLTTADGQSVTQTQLVNSSAIAPMQIYVDPDIDFAPATFTIRVKNRTANTIASFSYSNLGGGQIDTSESSQTVLGSITYTAAGLYRPLFTVTDAFGNRYVQAISLLVRDRSATDQTLQRVWSRFKNALSAGNKTAAMQALTASAQAQYASVFDALLPYLANIVSTWSALQPSSLDGESAEYGINKTIDGINRIFLIDFVFDSDGVWRLDSM
jgi:Bacterial Ig domain/Glucodextranase, domain B